MIADLHRLHDLLQALDRGFDDPDEADPTLIDEALDIVEALLIQHEKPDPIAPVGNCYRLPTPPPPPAPPVAAAAAPRRPENQQPKFGGRQKPKVSRPRKTKPQDEAA